MTLGQDARYNRLGARGRLAPDIIMKPTSRKLLLAFSALGIGSSAASTYVHYKLLTDPTYSSFCDVTANVSCTQAYMSQYGSFLGVPVAPVGLLYFVFVLLMAGIAGRTSSAARETAPAYIFAVSAVALAFVLYLGWASYFVLGVFCVLCAITYVSVVAIFIVSGGATPFPMTALPGSLWRATSSSVSCASSTLPHGQLCRVESIPGSHACTCRIAPTPECCR